MEFHLLENGVDSLELSLYFYGKYQDRHCEIANTEKEFDKNSYLKLTIMCLQNSVEILTKKVLSDVNELLIYSDISSKSGLLNYIQPVKNNTQPLHNLLIKEDAEVKTIDYLESILRLSTIFREMKEEYINSLKKIGFLRNKLIHFGISRPIDYHDIIGTINRTFEFILLFFVKDKMLVDKKEIENEIKYVLQRGDDIEEQLWILSMRDPFNKLVQIFEEACEKVNSTFEEQKLTLEILDSKEMAILYKNISNETETIIWSRNFPVMGCTVLLDFYNMDYLHPDIIALIDYNEPESFYICKEPYDIDYMYDYEKFWKQEPKIIFNKQLNLDTIDWFLQKYMRDKLK
ncbi:hypothetical protein [Neobacillus mesonae]|uniref:Uncharacterized protein n=1 Tax=Neobacillus mesonae TaxID=1193713 RepID=A0A3T0HZI7_9BACI|nr:hypothetical protein [Neobacillus mesonae]AZU62565.1 hypothetical protein CHR53_15525 [Neobacillus mesonae]